MAIREHLVASAAQFLQDPSVSSSSLDSRVSFLRTKNLTPEEIESALSRAVQRPPPSAHHGPPPVHPTQPPPGQDYYQPYPPQYGWQAPPSAPRRDWRDWFIMATVVGGVGFGLYTLGKRYIYPLIAPPTPDRLEQDKQEIQDQFDKAFGLVDQLAKDTETLKAAEQDRTQRLDIALADLETVITELKSANLRREDEAQRIRSDVQNLKESIPKAMTAQKDVTDNRLREISTELVSLKTLMSQRTGMSSSIVSSTPPSNMAPTPAPTSHPTATPPLPPVAPSIPSNLDMRQMRNSISHSSIMPPRPMPTVSETSLDDTSLPIGFGGLTRAATFSSSNPATAKASIPSWQLAMATKSAASSTANESIGPTAQAG